MNGVELAVVIATTAVSALAIGFTAGSALTRKEAHARRARMSRELAELKAKRWETNETVTRVTPSSRRSSSSSSDSTTSFNNGFVAGSSFGVCDSGSSGCSGSGGGGGD